MSDMLATIIISSLVTFMMILFALIIIGISADKKKAKQRKKDKITCNNAPTEQKSYLDTETQQYFVSEKCKSCNTIFWRPTNYKKEAYFHTCNKCHYTNVVNTSKSKE